MNPVQFSLCLLKNRCDPCGGNNAHKIVVLLLKLPGDT